MAIVNMTPAIQLTVCLPIRVLPWKPTFSNRFQVQLCTVSFGIAWLDHR